VTQKKVAGFRCDLSTSLSVARVDGNHQCRR
jgi:hypothetical protein